MATRVPISILDFCPVLEGETPREALQQATRLAVHAEKLGYRRFWVTEHHGAALAASSATPVVISHIASNTTTLRVGSGGVMLPNYAPFVVAEQFGTLASLHPGRIDLGLGRSTGTHTGQEQIGARALRLAPDAREHYVSDVQELQSYFRMPTPGQEFRAVPGSGLNVPLWLLGSSTFSAEEAGKLGLPFVFAAHIAPDLAVRALETYRANFRPSAALERPYAMICVLVVAADADDMAEYLLTSLQMTLLDAQRGKWGALQRPVQNFGAATTEAERAIVAKVIKRAVVGSPAKVCAELDQMIAETVADELMVLTIVYDQAARHRSFELLAQHGAFALS